MTTNDEHTIRVFKSALIQMEKERDMLTESIERVRQFLSPVTPVKIVTPGIAATRAAAINEHQGMSLETKRKIGSNAKMRWRVVRQAGIDTGGKLPNKEQVAQARKILAAKAKKP